MKGNWSRLRTADVARTWLSLAFIVGVSVCVVAFVGNQLLDRLMTDFFILCSLVIALQVFVGNSGIVSFGHVAFFGIGAYVAAILVIPPKIKEMALPLLPMFLQTAKQGLLGSTITAAVVSALIALATGLAFARMTETAMAMATLALLVMVHTVFANWETVTRGTVGLYAIPRRVNVVIAPMGLLIIAGIALLFKASPLGLRLQATRDDPLSAQSLGINIARTRLAGWTLSAFLMGAGGAFWAQHNLAFSSHQFYYAETFRLLSMLVIGGMGSVTGAIAGSAVVTLVSEILRPLENEALTLGSVLSIPQLPGIGQMAVALMIILILIVRPGGLLGRWEFGFRLWGLGKRDRNG